MGTSFFPRCNGRGGFWILRVSAAVASIRKIFFFVFLILFLASVLGRLPRQM
jgi:uncharacterized membrane protein YtjA (UPF0391 family)